MSDLFINFLEHIPNEVEFHVSEKVRDSSVGMKIDDMLIFTIKLSITEELTYLVKTRQLINNFGQWTFHQSKDETQFSYNHLNFK